MRRKYRLRLGNLMGSEASKSEAEFVQNPCIRGEEAYNPHNRASAVWLPWVS